MYHCKKTPNKWMYKISLNELTIEFRVFYIEEKLLHQKSCYGLKPMFQGVQSRLEIPLPCSQKILRYYQFIYKLSHEIKNKVKYIEFNLLNVIVTQV